MKKNTKKIQKSILKSEYKKHTKKGQKSILKNKYKKHTKKEHLTDFVDNFKYHSNFKKELSCYYQEYLNLQKPEFNYKNFYKTYESNEQFKALTKIGFNLNPSLITRLLEISLKRFNPKLTDKIYKIITSNNKDNIIYDQLRKLYKNSDNIKYIKSPIVCKGNMQIQQLINRYISVAQKNNGIINIKKYLDIGCGNGKFAITFGKVLNLEKNDIYGVDLGNFSEQGDWKRTKNINEFIFKELKYNETYPFEDNYFDFITIKMVLHHVKNIDFTLREIVRILKINGSIVIIEHDSFTYADYMLNDIEHGFYMNVFNENNQEENYLDLKDKTNMNDTSTSIGIHKYYSWPELSYTLRNYGFDFIRKQLFNNHINTSSLATRAYFYLYKLTNKNFIPPISY
jgi:ubiquinone/menaquinone biosynthesis C-methylase UbiE